MQADYHMDFLHEFRSRYSAIEERAPTHDPSLLKEIEQLKEECRSKSLPAHDVQSYETQLAALTDKVREKPRKFRFRSALKTPSTRDSQVSSGTPQNSDTAAAPRRSKLLIGPESDLDRCIVISQNARSVNIANISHSYIYLERVAGPVHLTNIDNCKIWAECHQLRLHDSNHCDIYVVGARPIIENCNGLKFGPETVEVDDFNWLQPGLSPNWTKLNDVPSLSWVHDEREKQELLESL